MIHTDPRLCLHILFGSKSSLYLTAVMIMKLSYDIFSLYLAALFLIFWQKFEWNVSVWIFHFILTELIFENYLFLSNMHCLLNTYEWFSNIHTLGRGKLLKIYLTPHKNQHLNLVSSLANLVRIIFNAFIVVWCIYFFSISIFTFNNKEYFSR